MSWKFWKSNDKSFIVDTAVVPTSTLFRWALFDLNIETPNDFAKTNGFTPISDEGAELELKDSDKRLSHLIAYKDFISTMATINAEISTHSHFSAMVDSDLFGDNFPLDEAKDHISELYQSISTSAIISTLAAALSLGIIVNPGTYITEESGANYYDF